MEVIKERPLSQYYLWQISINYTIDSKGNIEFPTTKQVIGQLKAERRNLEKLNSKMLSYHISSLAYLEEMLKNMSEESFRKLIQEVNELYEFILVNE